MALNIMKKTLVIHPQDPSTDFLKTIYQGKGFTELTTDINPDQLFEQMESHDRILMLGHGFHFGLLHYFKLIVDARHVPILKKKELVGIWCFAKQFFTRHHLNGFYSDMFISEPLEAQFLRVEASPEEIEKSNDCFAQLLRDNLDHPDRLQRIQHAYGQLNTTVSDYNNMRLFDR